MEHCTKKPGSEKELRSSLGDRDMPTFALRAPVGNLRLHRERRLGTRPCSIGTTSSRGSPTLIIYVRAAEWMNFCKYALILRRSQR